jgi:hypothetical protein
MKKFAIAILSALSFGAFAADFVSIDVDNVQGRQGASDSTAQYIRAGKGFGNQQVNVQGRTAKFTDGSLKSSVELTTSNKNVSAFGITPFVGVGHDNGSASAQSYNYGLVGATYGRSIGPGFMLTGVKTRVGSTQDGDRTKQTVAFASYSIPVAKNVAVNLNASRSSETIKEKAFGAGLSFSF